MPKPRHASIAPSQMLVGHSWTPPAGVRPCLLCAMKLRETPDMRGRHVVHGQWALDYPYNAGLDVRVRTSSAKWMTRPAFIAHLYPPWVSYWERRTVRHSPRVHEEVYVVFQEAEALRFLVDPRSGYARFTDPDGALEALLSEAARIGAASGEKGFWQAQSVLCRILDLLTAARRIDGNTWRIGARDESDGLTDLARTVGSYLRAQLGNKVTLDAIARQARVSASTLTHRYRAETGRTPMSALRDLRLIAAKGLLTKGWKLKEVAAQTGFVDAFHFSRTFKKNVGLAPRQFVNALRGKPNPRAGPRG